MTHDLEKKTFHWLQLTFTSIATNEMFSFLSRASFSAYWKPSFKEQQVVRCEFLSRRDGKKPIGLRKVENDLKSKLHYL